jgi:TM2 domain-containing membrane protein YozV
MEVCILGYRLVSKISLIAIIILSLFSLAFAQKDKQIQQNNISAVPGNVPPPILFEEPERKDPFIAGVLSWSWSGLGQFYTQNYKKGSAFLLADLAEKGLLVYMLFYISDKYSNSDEDVNWQDISKKDKTIVVGLLFSIFFTRVFSVIDAVDSAHDYNRLIYYPYWKSKQGFKTSFEPENKSLHISVSYPVNFK